MPRWEPRGHLNPGSPGGWHLGGTEWEAGTHALHLGFRVHDVPLHLVGILLQLLDELRQLLVRDAAGREPGGEPQGRRAGAGSRQRPGLPGHPQPRAQGSCPVSLEWSLAVPPRAMSLKAQSEAAPSGNQPLLWPSPQCFYLPCWQSTCILLSYFFYWDITHMS